MSIADKLQTIAENEQRVYDAGKEKEWSDFWDAFQENGNRTDYTYAFRKWNESNFKPKYNLFCNSNMFAYSKITNLKAILEECNVTLRLTTSTTNLYNAFNEANTITHIPDLSAVTVSGNTTYGFRNAYELHTIDGIRFSETATFTNTFYKCYELKNITVYGTIGTNFSISYSPLTAESCKSIITALKDYSGTEKEFTYILTLSQTAKDNINAAGAITEADSIPEAIGITWLEWAGEKGWNVA